MSNVTLEAQNTRITFPAVNMSLSDAIDTIEKQTKYIFSYKVGVFGASERTVFNDVNLSLDEALRQMLKGRGLKYTIRSRYIIIQPGIPERTVKVPGKKTGDVYVRTNIASVDALPKKREEETPVTGEKQEVKQFDEVKEPEVEMYSVDTPLADYVFDKKHQPLLAVKTNLLYAATSTPNLGAEIGLGYKTSLKLSGSYNPWNRIGTLEDNDKFVHWIVTAEFKYWFCERFNGHYIGAGLFGSKFNIGGYKVPLVNFKKEHRYRGSFYGGGINYGYQLALAKKWGLEFSAGVGVAKMRYDVYDCKLCSSLTNTKDKIYLGPTHAAISLIFLIK